MAIETERIRLLLWRDDDWQAFRPIATDPEVMRYITNGVPWSDEQVREFITRQMRWYDQRGFCLWKLVQSNGGRLIGFAGLQPLLVEGAPEIEIGWWLAKNCWGQGLATEAATAALRDGFDRVGLKRIVAIARPENVASIRVMQKLGLQYEREFIHKEIRHVLYATKVRPASLTRGERESPPL